MLRSLIGGANNGGDRRIPRGNACMACAELSAWRARARPDSERQHEDQDRRSRHAHVARPHGGKRLDRADVAESNTAAAACPTNEAHDPGRGNAGPRLPRAVAGMGLSMLGPVLLEYGTEEQRQRTSRKSCAAKSAGARAIPNRRRLRPRQPVAPARCCRASTSWSTATRSGPPNAQSSDWIFCLVRTDPTVKKHDGISFLLHRHGRSRRAPAADPADQRQVGRSAKRSSRTSRSPARKTSLDN